MSSKSIDFVSRILQAAGLRRVLRNFTLARIQRRDLKRMNRADDELNAEAIEVLDYQDLSCLTEEPTLPRP
jgi:hypothetical protein